MKRIWVFWVALAALSWVSGCATGASSDRGDAEVTAERKADIHELILGADTPFVVRIDADEWESVRPYFQALNDTAPDTDLSDIIGPYVEHGPLRPLFDELILPQGKNLERSRSIWLTAAVVDGEDAVRAARAGLPWLPEQDWPTAAYVRVLIPVKDAANAHKKIDRIMEMRTGDDAYRVERFKEHVLVDLFDVRHDLEKTPVDELLSEAGKDAARNERQTPALAEFLASDSPFSVYVRTRELREFAAAQTSSDTANAALEQNRVKIQQLLWVRHAADTLNLYWMAPSFEREFEDVALISRPAGDGGVAVDIVATRTARGKKVYEASAAEVALPTLNPKVLPDDKLLANGNWQHDFVALADALPAAVDDKKVTLGDGSGPLVNRRTMYTLESAVDRMGWTPIAGLLHSPYYLPRMIVSILGEELRAAVPTAMRMRIVEAKPSESAQLPVAGAVVVRFSGSKAKLEALLDKRQQMVGMLGAFGAAHRVVEAPGGGSEWHIALGHPLDEVIVDERTVVTGGIDATLQSPKAFGPPIVRRALAAAGPVVVRSGHSPTVARWTVAAGAEVPSPKPLQATIELSTNPAACLATLTASGKRMLEQVERLPPTVTPDDVDEAVAPYDAAANACANQATEHKELMRWATGRVRWFAVSRIEQYVLPDIPKKIQACKDGNQWSCDWLSRKWEKGDYPAELNTYHDTVAKVLADACERGDKASCAKRKEMPALEELMWRPKK